MFLNLLNFSNISEFFEFVEVSPKTTYMTAIKQKKENKVIKPVYCRSDKAVGFAKKMIFIRHLLDNLFQGAKIIFTV